MIDRKTVKNGNSVAVRLPKELGFTADMAIEIEPNGVGKGITIRPKFDPVEEKRRVTEFVEAMLALGPPLPHQPREPIDFPDRPGLYRCISSTPISRYASMSCATGRSSNGIGPTPAGCITIQQL